MGFREKVWPEEGGATQRIQNGDRKSTGLTGYHGDVLAAERVEVRTAVKAFPTCLPAYRSASFPLTKAWTSSGLEKKQTYLVTAPGRYVFKYRFRQISFSQNSTEKTAHGGKSAHP